MYRDIPDDLKAMIEPIVDEQGCELVDVDLVGGGGITVLRVTIDTQEGDGRVPVDCCAGISRELGTQLEATQVIPGSYRLEVSSPGLDRVLAREKDFTAACGLEIKVKTRRPLNGRRRFKGVLLGFEDGVARVSMDDAETEIPFEEIEKANTIYQFSRADFDGRAAE